MQPRIIFKTNSWRCGFIELWRHVRSPLVVLVWIGKLFRQRLSGSMHDPNVEALEPFRGGFTAEAQAVVERFTQPLAEAGFDTSAPALYSIKDVFNNSRTSLAILPRPDGRAFARLAIRSEGNRLPATQRHHCDFVSERPDGAFLESTGARAVPAVPPQKRLVALRPGATVPRLWAAHEAALQEWAPSGVTLAPTLEAACEQAARHHALVRDFNLRRGVFEPLSAQEQDDARALEAAFAANHAGGEEVADVMVEVERLQQRRTGVSESLLLLAFSLLAFGLSARTGWADSRRSLLLLVPILFVHELGHFVAMRFFGYRNVRMFFIPFLGAAVTGQNHGVESWKKVVVALAGPLPGILLGGLLGALGLILQQPLLVQAAMMALALNGLNLLPVLPLDGGRVAHLLVFSRHPLLEVGFRTVAGGALMFWGFSHREPLLGGLGMGLLVGLSAAHRLARLGAGLRGAPETGGAEAVPSALAPQLISQLRAALPRVRSKRALAQHALNVIDTVRARPPRLAATLGLGTLQLGGLLGAAVFAALLIVGRGGGDLSASLRALKSRGAPTQRVSAADLAFSGHIDDSKVVHEPPPPGRDAASYRRRSLYDRQLPARTFVAANLPDAKAARSLYEQVRPGLGDDQAAGLFGETVLVSVAASDVEGRRAWLRRLQQGSKDAFAIADGFGVHTLRLRCQAASPAAAKALADELAAYGSVARLNAIPPWTPETDDPRSADERAQQARARRTYYELQQAGRAWAAGPAPDAKQSAAFDQALKSGDQEELARLQQVRARELKERRTAALEQVRASPASDPEIVTAYLGRIEPRAAAVEDTDDDGRPMADLEAEQKDLQALAPRFGLLPLVDGRPLPGARRYASSALVARATEASLDLPWNQFDDLLRGPPAVVRWLEGRGCGSITYELRAPGRAGLAQ